MTTQIQRTPRQTLAAQWRTLKKDSRGSGLEALRMAKNIYAGLTADYLTEYDDVSQARAAAHVYRIADALEYRIIAARAEYAKARSQGA